MPPSPIYDQRPQRLVLATDLGARCDRAMDRSVQLARAWDAELVVANVIETEAAPDKDAPAWRQDGAPADLVRHLVEADVADPAVRLKVEVRSGNPPDVVADLAETHAAGLIVTGIARDPALGPRILGRLVERLARTSPAPTLIVSDRARGPYRRVVVGLDFSKPSTRAIHTALAYFPDAAVELFHAFQPPARGRVNLDEHRDQLRELARKEVDKFLRKSGPEAALGLATVVEPGDAPGLLADYVHTVGADLVVLGAESRGALTSAIIGGAAARMLSALRGDVLLVR